MAENASSTERLRVLVVDNDADIAELVTAVLTDEGYEVASLQELDHDAIAATVGREEPDCVLLDSTTATEGTWGTAAELASRGRRVPTIMFSAHPDHIREAREGTTERAAAAEFAAVVAKPFTVDELLEAVELAAGRSRPFDRSAAGDQNRNADLVRELTAAGATDIGTSTRREWATFRSPHDDRIYQLYWWQLLGLYIVGFYGEDARLTVIGQFFDRDAAIAAALGRHS
jgi:CheY-like chemotaxis protein